MRAAPALAVCLALAAGAASGQVDERQAPIGFADLVDWAADDHLAAFRTFRRTCGAIERGEDAVGSALPVPDDLVSACLASAALFAPDRLNARHFFEAWFEPVEIGGAGRPGFLTGYFEPELSGARERDPAHPVPLLAPPADHVALEGPPPPGWPAGLTAARRTPDGFAAYPDRAAIEAGALEGAARPVAWVADTVDALVAQIQGSARLRLPDGGTMRVGFAGRNGQPYTAVGRILAEQLGEPAAAMTADRVYGWLRDHPADAPAIIGRNSSFIFFRALDLPPGDGPRGAAGVPLTAGRSLAVDRTRWSYGLPVWLETDLPAAQGATAPLRRLAVAQDTGAAITGTARGDLFFGSGPEAGAAAAPVRQAVRFVVLLPRGRGGIAVRP